ncbi:MAG: metal-dependent hydrolase [Candidatus Pacearchaeota archaeon]
MLFRTHFIFALLLFMIFVLNSNMTLTNKLVFLIFLLLAASFPDIDVPTSKIGRKAKILSNLANVLFKHRGFLQSLTFLGLLYLAFFIFRIPKIIALAFTLGYSSHLLLDAFTKTGIYLFWPLKLRVKGPIKTGSLTESLIFLILLFAFLYAFLKNFSTMKEIISKMISFP